jgi:hypothetical protein
MSSQLQIQLISSLLTVNTVVKRPSTKVTSISLLSQTLSLKICETSCTHITTDSTHGLGLGVYRKTSCLRKKRKVQNDDVAHGCISRVSHAKEL